jgi:hypothetical protein
MEAATLALPTAKTPPSLSLDTSKLLVYGPAGVGKSTLAAGIDPDHTLFLATEPGLGGLEVFQQRITTWQQFRDAGSALANEKHPYRVVVVDTVDELSRMCVEAVLDELNLREKRPKKAGEYIHVSDFEYGKGYDAVGEEFRLRVAKLCSLGLGVVFTSHAKEGTVKSRTGEELTTFAPDIGQRKLREWLIGFVDYILLARPEGDQRVLRTRPTEQYEAKSRVQGELPDPLPLDAGALRKAIEEATKT